MIKRFLDDEWVGAVEDKCFRLVKIITLARIYVSRPHRKDILVAEKLSSEIRFTVEGLPKKYMHDTVTLFNDIVDAAKIDIEFAAVDNTFVAHNHETGDISVVTSITLPYNTEPVFTPILTPTFEQMAVLL